MQSWASNPDNPEHPEHTPVDPRKSGWQQANITLESLTIGYKTLTEPVLANLNCTFAPGQIHAIVGPSGSGKSTLVNTILGLHPPISGEIQVGRSSDDQATLREEVPVKAWLANIGYLSQQPFLFNGSVRENLTMRVPNMTVDEEEVNRLIAHLDLTDCLGDEALGIRIAGRWEQLERWSTAAARHFACLAHSASGVDPRRSNQRLGWSEAGCGV